MELWIRSQDRRTILKAYRIDVDDKNIIVWDNNYLCSETYMGEYATTERALEVLDEIQKVLIGKREMITTQDKKGIEFIPFIDTLVVYEMPKE